MFSGMQNKYYLAYFVKNLIRGGTLLDLLLTNLGKENKIGPVKTEGNFGCSDYEAMEFKTTDPARN